MSETLAGHIDGPLYWERMGREGPPIVFLHPNPTDHRVWIYQMARFSTWFRAIGIDLPGYGRSPTAFGVQMADVAAACWEAVDATSAEPAILVGCSVGYTTALHMARLQPARTAALILSGASYRPVKQFAAKRIEQYSSRGIAFRREHFFEVVGPAFRGSPLAEYFADLFTERDDTSDADTIVEVFRALGDPDPDWLFDSVRAPTLIVTGSEDSAHQASFGVRDRIQGAELRTIEGAGHACQLERPWEWDGHAIDFLRRHDLLT